MTTMVTLYSEWSFVQEVLFFRKLMDGLRCIDEFTYRCLDVEHRNYFNTLYQGTTQVIVDLCQRGQYQSGEDGCY